MGSICSVDMLAKGMIHVLGGTEWDSVRLHHDTQNGAQFKTYELSISGNSHLIFLDHGWLWVTERGKQNHGVGGTTVYLNLIFEYLKFFCCSFITLLYSLRNHALSLKIAKTFWYPVWVQIQLWGTFYLKYPKMPSEFQKSKHN